MRLGLYGQDIYYYAIMIGSSTYVGMITFGGQEGNAGMEGIVRYGDQGGGQPEIGSSGQSYLEKNHTREGEKRSQQPGIL